MNLLEEAGAALISQLAGVEMQRFYVHVMARGGVTPEVARLVLHASADKLWCAADDGTLVLLSKGGLVVCAGRECLVDGCTRAESLRTVEAGYGATPASEALDLLPSPLTEGENQAITEYHRGIEAEIANLADFLEREFPEPLVPRGAAAVLGEVHRLLLELKSRRAEQGKLADHPSDSPITRIRFWMEHNYPAEQSETLPLSEWVISKLEDGKGIREYRTGQMGAVVGRIEELWPEKVPAGGWMGNAASTTIALLEELHGLYRKAQSRPVLSEGQLPEGGQPIPYDLRAQIDRLATYILDEVPGEPSQSEGAVDTAIRIMRDLRQQVEVRKEVQSAQLGPILVAVDRLFRDDAKVVLNGGWQQVEVAIPAILETVAAKYQKQNERIDQTLLLLATGDEAERKLGRDLRAALGKEDAL